MPRRRPAHGALARAVVVVLALAALALPATSRASESLLSGYGGPGGGEQVILGAQLLEPPAGGGGALPSLRATRTATRTAAPIAAAPAPHPIASAPTTPARRGHSHARRAPRHAPPAVRPRVVAYPTRASDAGGLPLSATDLLVIFIGLTTLVFVGLGLRALRTGNPPAAGPQAPAAGTDH